MVAPDSEDEDGEEDDDKKAGNEQDEDEEMSDVESSGCSVIDDVETDEISDLTESDSD